MDIKTSFKRKIITKGKNIIPILKLQTYMLLAAKSMTFFYLLLRNVFYCPSLDMPYRGMSYEGQ